MHIPDNFLSPPVWATLDCIAVPAVAMVSRRARASADTSQTPLLGVLGAFVFAAQMVNFPVGIGTSGHLVGGTLLACIVGPWAAALVMTSILILQALVFQDGGVLALGANVINMALLGVVAGYTPARLLARTKRLNSGIFVGGLCSVLVSGILAISELLMSGIRMPVPMIQVSLLVFVVNGILEGAITISALRAIERIKPGVSILATESSRVTVRPGFYPTMGKLTLAIGFMAILVVAAGLAINSNLPDRLDNLAIMFGVPLRTHFLADSPLRDYYVRQLGMTWMSRAAAGLFGIGLIYLVCALGTHLLARARRSYS